MTSSRGRIALPEVAKKIERMTASANGVVAIIITIMALELKVPESAEPWLADALNRDWKGKLSLIGDFVAVPLAFLTSRLAIAVYVIIACVWLIPDRRIEQRLTDAT